MSRGGCAGWLLAGEAGREPEVGDLHLAGGGVDEDVVGLQVLVDDALLVNVRDRPRDGDGEREKALHRHRRPEELVEGLAAEVLQDEGRHALVRLEGERLDDGRGVEEPSDLVFVLQLLEVLRAAAPRIEHLEDHRAAIGAPDRAIDGRSPPWERDSVIVYGADGLLVGMRFWHGFTAVEKDPWASSLPRCRLQ